ncbi:hypothetical protein INT48_001055 [Thamnidium elegans]|uniref:Uncharacterized protein n=1 Tax=Thamnidium elegans TaxID=101142 RepID=A0A8H7SRJ3_9FUNG|nr:hypothetical protein INT48_001055 [Thamnidium elegans]
MFQNRTTNYNEQITTTSPSSSYSYGRKVDLIIATFYNGVKYELSANEWKREKVPDPMIMKHENGSKCTISMDWFGMIVSFQ